LINDILKYYGRPILAGVIIFLSLFTGVPFTDYSQHVKADAVELQIGELTANRTANSKLFYIGETEGGGKRYVIESSIGQIHYQEQGDWLDIDNSWYMATSPYDITMNHADYSTKVVYDFTAGQILEFEKDGYTVNFQPMGLEWTNDISQIQPISMPQDVVPTLGVSDITWENGYGSGIDFTWQNQATRLAKLLTVSGLNDLPPPQQYVIDGGNAALRLNFLFDPDSELDIYVNGQLWDKKTKRTTAGLVEFRNSLETVWSFTQPYYWDSSEEPERQTGLTELSASGKSLYVSILVPYEWLQSAEYPVFIDPTIDVAVSASGYDADELVSTGGVDIADDKILAVSSDVGGNEYMLGLIFLAPIAQGSAITACTVNTTIIYSSHDNPNFTIHMEDTANASAFQQINYNISGRALVSGNVSYVARNVVTPDEWDDFSAVLQDVVDAYTTEYISVITKPISDGAWTYYIRDWDQGGGFQATIHIEYTTGGASAPTMDTTPATNIEETTANGTGNCTATGGENLDIRGIRYGTLSGGSYTANVSDSGNFTDEEYSLEITGLTPGTAYITNAFGHNSAGWGFATDNETFITLPNPAAGVIITATGNTTIDVEWTEVTGADKYTVRYATGATPPSDNVTDDFWAQVSGNTTTITGLTSGQYSIGVFPIAIDEGLYSCGASDSDTDYTLPADPTGFTVSNPSANSLDLDWTLGTGSDYTRVKGKIDTAPTDISDGRLVYYNTGNSVTDNSLNATTTYVYRMWAYDSASGYYSAGNATANGTTTSGVGTPSVTTNAATSVEETTTTLNGNVTDVSGDNVTRWFWWDTDLTAPFSDNWSEGLYGTGAYSHGLTGLDRGDKYAFHASANNSAGSANGSILYFMTKPDPATGFSVTSTGTTWAALGWTNGTAMYQVTVRYSDSGYPTDNVSDSPGYTGNGTSCNVTGLDSNTTYYFLITTHAMDDSTWSTADGTVTASDTTDIGAPGVAMNAASGVTNDSAQLNATITDDGGDFCNGTFFWGTVDGGQTDNWTNTANQTGLSAGAINYSISGTLLSATTYYGNIRIINGADTAWGTSINWTTSNITAIYPPSSFTLTDMGAISVLAEWVKGLNSTYTMIRMSRADYPVAITDGELFAYNDNVTANVTGFDLDVNDFFFTAWGFAADNVTYSGNVSQATIGGESMDDLADAMEGIGDTIEAGVSINMTGITELVIVVAVMLGLASLAYWRGDKPLFLLSGCGFLIYGFSYGSTSLWFSIIMVGAGFFLCIRAFTKKGVT